MSSPVRRPGRVLSTPAQYSLAFGAVAVALLARYALDPWLADNLPFVTMFGGIAAAVWIGGYRPALVVTAIGFVVCDYLFIAPRGSVAITGFAGDIGLLAYLFTSALIILFGEATRRAQVLASDRHEVLRVTLRSIGDAVITTDVAGQITYMNGVAETLTGWTLADALGRPLDSVFRIVSEGSWLPVENPATKALRQGIVVGLANHTVLLRKGGDECPIDDSAAPITDERGHVSGCVLIFRDVSAQRAGERERAEQLHAARLLASIVQTSDDAIISKSLDGTIQSWNPAAERLFGHTAAQAIGQPISIVIPPERLHEEDDIVTRLRAGERLDHFETERRRADGTPIRVSLTVSPIRDAEGQVVGASKIVRDVTRQREAEERERHLLAQAADANAKFQAFFEQGALFAGIMDLDGTILEANRVSYQGCGYTREQVVAKPFWDGPWWSPSPRLVEQIRAGCANAAAGEVFRAELPYFVADGTERVVDVTILPIRDEAGRVVFLAPTGIDITDRKRAEADREKFVTLVENSTDFIGLCDLEGVPFFVNRAGLQMVGLDSIDEARRTPVAAFFFPEDQPRILQEFLPSVLRGGHGEIEIRFRHFRTGAALWMAYKVLTLPDAEGKPVAFATVSQDVTERKRLEQNLRNLAGDLAEADRRKNEFLAMLAHELRNPLAPISNAARALRLGGTDAQALRSAADMLERQVGHMGRLVDDLLDMSRITRGKIELRRERVELAPIVRQAAEAVQPLCRGLHHELIVTLPEEPVHLYGDPTRLTQVIGNLLNNACKFTDRGGHIRLTVLRDGDHATIRVQDDGIGIAPENLAHLFDMFAQVDTSLERSRDGLGIGLTLVKTLVEMHGGTVTAHSAGLGHGSEFEVRLPIDTAAPVAAVKSSVLPMHATRRRVLIVDDSEDGAESLAMLLQFEGHDTAKAHDGLEAIAAAERFRPDAVLLDIGLPRMNGYEACRRIRQEPWGKHLLLIALTGWGMEEDRTRSKEAGFDAHLVKPVDFDVLLKLLGSLPDAGYANAPVSQ